VLVQRMRTELTATTELAQWIEQHPQLVR